jgi:molybdopterin adenylyltransferase
VSATKKTSHQSPSPAFNAAVLTISDSSARGERVDQSGPAVAHLLKEHGFLVVATEICADERSEIQRTILRLAGKANLVVTTGGTGIAARDVTPEATRAVCDRLIEGISERIRIEGSKKTPFAALSRGLCGVCKGSLVLNLPGRPKGAVDSLQAVIELVPHALQLIAGNTGHQ